MLLQTVKSEIVSHLSYIFGSKNEAAVIDPRRDCQIYLDVSRKWEAKIKYIFETHRNEDYVIGSIELSKKTGAEVFHGPGLEWAYGKTLIDGEEFTIGSLKIKALHTPGHSPDSVSYALYDVESGGPPVAVFTGDTLFVGDTGRTDFLGSEMTPVMAGKMYDSITKRLFPLGDEVIIFPAHGFGSVCGGEIREREISTLGSEKKTNRMLRLSREDFIKAKVSERHETPPYFKRMELYNLSGPPQNGLPEPLPLKPEEFRREVDNGAQVVDVRSALQFGAAHIKGSYSLPPSRLLNVGWVLDYETPILLVVNDDKSLDFAVRSLYRLGYDRVVGYLSGGIDSWLKEGLPIGQLGLITVHRLKEWIDAGERLAIVDVRRQNEWDNGHIAGSTHIYLGHLKTRTAQVPRDRPVIVVCKTGNRSSFGASILVKAGFTQVYNCLGGIDAWRKSKYPLV